MVAEELELCWDGGPAHSGSGLMPGIRKCSKALQAKSVKKQDYRRVWLMTNDDDPSAENPGQSIKDAAEQGIAFELWHCSRPEAAPFDLDKFYRVALAVGPGDEAEKEDRYRDCSTDLEKLLDVTEYKSFRKRRLARMALRLPGPDGDPKSAISFNVNLYKTVQPCRKPAAVELDSRTNKKLVSKTKLISDGSAEYVEERHLKYGVDFADTRAMFEKLDYRQLANKAGAGEQGEPPRPALSRQTVP